MGPNISKQIDEQSFKQITEDLFTTSLFKKLKNPGTNTVSQENLLNYFKTVNDVFITHSWNVDSHGRDNHFRVSKIVRRLQELGLKVWFDEEKMEGRIKKTMCDGIDSARVVIVCVTELYISKVNEQGSDGANDNCLFEFMYACDRKIDKIIPVVMEYTCKTTSDWYGPVGGSLGGTLYYIRVRLKDLEIETVSLNSDNQCKFSLDLKSLGYTKCYVYVVTMHHYHTVLSRFSSSLV